MIYSVWNADGKYYDYYEGQGSVIGQPIPRHLRNSTPVGTVPEAAAWPMPRGLKAIGKGKIARGSIGTVSNGIFSGLGSVDAVPVNLVVAIGLGIAAWGLWRLGYAK